MNKFLKYLTLFTIVSFNYLHALDKEQLETYTDAITEAQESFSKLSEAKTQEGKILDEAINKINEATSYIEKSLDVNNNKEAIKALEYCDSQEEKQLSLKEIKIYTDSLYLKEGITSWISNWEKNNWITSDKKNVKNVDLWKKLLELVKSKQIEWCWIKGHSNDPMNDLADKLAKEATPI